MTSTITPPIPNRLATIGSRHPSALPPPPPKPKPPPLRPVTSSKLLLSRSSPNRMPVLLLPPPMPRRRYGCNCPRSRHCSSHDSDRKNGTGDRLNLGHWPRDRQSARGRRCEADDQRLRRSGGD